MRRVMRPLQLLDVDRLRPLVAVLFFEGHLGALAQRPIPIAGNPGEVDEEITPALVGRDEPEALFVREPLDRSGAHRSLACCFGAPSGRRTLRPAGASGPKQSGRYTLSGRERNLRSRMPCGDVYAVSSAAAAAISSRSPGAGCHGSRSGSPA